MAEQSHFSRFMIKFFEISVAGMATAASGFVIAHITGFFMSQTPASVQPVNLQPAIMQPATPAVAVAPPVAVQQPAANTATSAPAANATAPAAPAQPAEATRETPNEASKEAIKEAPPLLRDTVTASPPAKPVVNTARQSPAPSPTPPADQSLEAKVRAALAKAPKAAPVKPAPRQADLAAKPVTPDASHAPADTGTVVASTPRDADPAAAAPQPLPQPAQAAAPVSAPMPIAPPQTTTIEIKSAPVVGEDAASAQPPAVDAQASAQADAPSPGKDFISAIKNFPTYLRTDTGALAPDQAPRPPRDIGVQ